MRIAREEIFGPVLSVIAYEDEGGPEGLAEYLETCSMVRASARRME
jgi:hypothetical protein